MVLQKRMNDVVKGQLLMIPSVTVGITCVDLKEREDRMNFSLDSAAKFPECSRNAQCCERNFIYSNP